MHKEIFFLLVKRKTDTFFLSVSFLVLFVPSFYFLSKTTWVYDIHSHGPIVLFAFVFLVYKKFDRFLCIQKATRFESILGWLVLFFSSALYFIARTQEFPVFDALSFLTFVIAVILIYKGWQGLLLLWFPVFFLIFLIPIPGSIIAPLTLPLKNLVSYLAEQVLFYAGFPVAREGVILQIGQYKLLVAEACAGLHTMISLEALGLLYLYLVESKSALRNITIGVLIIPISITANTIRVLVLALITYYLGDEAGQGFLHEFSGFLLFFIGLIIIIMIDSMLYKFFSRNDGKF